VSSVDTHASPELVACLDALYTVLMTRLHAYLFFTAEEDFPLTLDPGTLFAAERKEFRKGPYRGARKHQRQLPSRDAQRVWCAWSHLRFPGRAAAPRVALEKPPSHSPLCLPVCSPMATRCFCRMFN
jgi:hypothetical protein